MKKLITIDGMGCEHCVKSVKEALSSLKNLNIIDIKIGEAAIEIPADFDMDLIIEALDDAGYEVKSIQ
ncbi:heavy-metal-associated domain-containing protein [Fusobacterium sp.]|uniref:heavy-metal-associated domain-containing protein n=1 Tax=Fusobacterium sp. TaxID=68766 RepID=UPI00396CAE51